MKTAAEILANKKANLITVSSNQTVAEALEVMNANRIGSIVVIDEMGERVVGIWTERDLIQDILKEGFDPRTAIIGDYMTRELQSAPVDATLEELKEKLLSLFIRHLFIEKDGRYIGLLSVGDVVRASLIAQNEHIAELKAHTSWHYYENWGWEA